MSDQIRANTDELRRDGFDQFVGAIAKANEEMQRALDANPNPVPSVRCDADEDVAELVKAAKERAETIMKALGGIVDGGGEGVKTLGAIFEKMEDENQELGYDKPIRNMADVKNSNIHT